MYLISYLLIFVWTLILLLSLQFYVFEIMFYYSITHKITIITLVIQNWIAYVLQMHTYLMSSTCNWIAFNERAIWYRVIIYFYKLCLTLLDTIILIRCLSMLLRVWIIDRKNSLFMGQTDYWSIEHKSLKRKITTNSSIVHFFH